MPGGHEVRIQPAASLWQDMMEERLTMSTFDRRLWGTAQTMGFLAHPQGLPDLLEAWRREA